MVKNQKGFTLIELVMVIVILGILAAVAIPRYINLTVEAANAAVQGVAGSISSASAINYAAISANPAAVGTTVTIGLTCTTAAAALLQGGLPTGYTTTAAVIVAGPNTCAVNHADATVPGSATILGI